MAHFAKCNLASDPKLLLLFEILLLKITPPDDGSRCLGDHVEGGKDEKSRMKAFQLLDKVDFPKLLVNQTHKHLIS